MPPTVPPPSALSAGPQSAENRKSEREWWNMVNVPEPLYTRNAPIQIVITITRRPPAVISPLQAYSFANILVFIHIIHLIFIRNGMADIAIFSSALPLLVFPD